MNETPVVKVALQRWRFGEPAATSAPPCGWLPELGLGLAGDALGGSRVGAAALWVLALAERMAAKAGAAGAVAFGSAGAGGGPAGGLGGGRFCELGVDPRGDGKRGRRGRSDPG